MNKINIFLTFLMCTFCSIPAFTQTQKSIKDLLTVHIWKEVKDSRDEHYMDFSDNTFENILKRDTLVRYPGIPYYLSDSIDKKFSKEKQGSLNNGKYIIRDVMFGVFVYEIIKITDKELIIKMVYTDIGKQTEFNEEKYRAYEGKLE